MHTTQMGMATVCSAVHLWKLRLHLAAGAAKRKVQCIQDLPRNSLAVLCAAIVLMGVDLKPKVPAHDLLRCLPDAVLPGAKISVVCIDTIGCQHYRVSS